MMFSRMISIELDEKGKQRKDILVVEVGCAKLGKSEQVCISAIRTRGGGEFSRHTLKHNG